MNNVLGKVRTVALMLATVAPLPLGACTSTSTSGTASAVAPSAYRAGATTATDVPVVSAPTHQGDTFTLPPEPGFDPDSIVEAP